MLIGLSFLFTLLKMTPDCNSDASFIVIVYILYYTSLLATKWPNITRFSSVASIGRMDSFPSHVFHPLWFHISSSCPDADVFRFFSSMNHQ